MKLSKHTKLSPANNQNADKDDFIHSEIKGEDIIQQEIELMTSLNESTKTILDIGCGTGRHSVPLAKLGYEVTAIDLSKKMLEVLKSKVEGLDPHKEDLRKLDLTQTRSQILDPRSLRVIHNDILTHDFGGQKFDLIILMWNALNEIAMDNETLRLFFQKIKVLMNEQSRVVINIDNLENIDLENIDHKLSVTVDEFKYESDWKVEELNKENNITHSRETISKYDLNGNLIDRSSGIVIQKWWRKEEIQEIAGEFGINFEVRGIQGNEELYLVGRTIL